MNHMRHNGDRSGVHFDENACSRSIRIRISAVEIATSGAYLIPGMIIYVPAVIAIFVVK